ncbi:MAG TPA: iron ABC transporter permease [Xanthobacteraceae bacterium]|jgi:iron(III) transport system permease protein|nr:iron ABC transporter permease [Xanthobacteraceae bacterium]
MAENTAGSADAASLAYLASPAPQRRWLVAPGLWLIIVAIALLVLPPFVYLVSSSLSVPGSQSRFALDNYRSILDIGGAAVWTVSLAFAAGSTLVAAVLGFSVAWLVARTDVPFRQTAYVSAFLSLGVPLIVKGIGWILLLGPNNGLINQWLRALGAGDAAIRLYTLGGMISVEGLLWTPVAFLLLLPPLAGINPALEEAAAMAGATRWQTFRRVTFPLARPSVLAILLLSFIRALESFEVPLLIGIPGDIETVTTALYQRIHSGFLPQYGEASAYAVLLIAAVALPLFLYYRATRESSRFATLTGKGFQTRRIALGRWRVPCALWVLLVPLSLAAPLIIMIWASFLPLYTNPSRDDFSRLTLDNYAGLWRQPETWSGLTNSLIVAGVSATLVAVATLIFSWLVLRRKEPVRWTIDILVSLPLVFPGLVLGIAILVEFLRLPFIPIYGTVWIFVVAFVIKFMPYGMRFNYSGVLAIARELEESGQMSGASTVTVLRRIVLPLAMPAVWATWVYVFIYAIRDLSTAVLLSGPRSALVSVVILELWNNGEVPQLAALSVFLAIIVSLFALLLMRLSRAQGLNP